MEILRAAGTILTGLLLWPIVILRDGFEQLRVNPRRFLRTLAHIPGFLFTLGMGRVRSLQEHAEARLGEVLRAAPFGEFERTLFESEPEAWAIVVAHKATLQFWYAPLFRMRVSQTLRTDLLRYWSWRYGVTEQTPSSPSSP